MPVCCEKDAAEVLNLYSDLIPYGNGKSYGDSALWRHIAVMQPMKRMLDFDEERGLLHCEAGVLLSEIIEVFLPRGWFLMVTPGTKLITVGGAIAADVHGKNHHRAGCFSSCVESFRLMLPDGTIRECSRESHRELFLATCGGMGLTGLILDAKIRLKRVNSCRIEQTLIRTESLEETFKAFEDYASTPYSVAWIDCLAKGKAMGRCHLMVGDFADDGDLNYRLPRRMNVPVEFPSFCLNSLSVTAFNTVYYHKAKAGVSQAKIGLDEFFYPLDSIHNWNRIYGRPGFTQYQFILPKAKSFDGLSEILERIARSGKGSFLAVLKLYGPANENWLSFPLEGYSLALDFKIDQGLFKLLDELDQVVLRYGGRIYLAKDVRVSRETFEQGYPNIGKFCELRKELGLDRKFKSLQSERLGL
ncbi:MAG: FAD-binding oxidoreductase [Lentisphaerae bacterium]|nr:MAG: FAD-binding oxidoreductase [Lentisphaerota bacterium]